MQGRVIFFATGALALAAFVAQPALAQPAGVVCQIPDPAGDGAGVAIIGPDGLNGSAPSNQKFAFEGVCDSGAHVCSIGNADNATCLENVTSGDFVFCSGDCQFKVGNNVVNPTAGNVANINGIQCAAGSNLNSEGSFNGACVGSLCAGAGTNVLYALVFDQQTNMDALATCPPAPVGPGGSVTRASFSEVIVY